MKTVTTKQLFAFILLLATLAAMMCACDSGNPGGDESSSESNTEASIDPIVLAEGEDTEYKIVRSEFITDLNLNVYKEFVNEFRTTTDVYFTMSDDFYRRDLDPSEFTEILFGTVNRDESRSIYNEIGYDGYAIKSVGNKIVIAAYTPDALKEASDRFMNECIKVEETDSGKKVTYVKDIVEKGTVSLFFNDENKLSDYVIVYAPGCDGAARSLANYLEKYNNLELEIVSHNEPETENEILVGATNRNASKNTTSDSKIGFVFKTVGTKVVINSDNSAYVKNAVEYVKNTFIRTAPLMNFAVDTGVDSIAYVGTDNKSLYDGSDIRVMSFNILSEEWTDEAVLEPRIIGVVGTILYYMPDVIGIQEVSTNWYAQLKSYLKDDYVFINSDILNSTNNNYTALAFNKNTVKLITSDFYQYSVYNSKRLRSINFGLFETLEGGTRFAVTNTHFNANHGGDNTPQRETQATEFVKKIKEYYSKYSCPIIMTGDYNVNEGTSPYNIIVADGSIKETKYTAQFTGKICRTYHNLGELPPDTTASIDHIFYTGAITPVYYTTLSDDVLKMTSDHCPIFCDFKFSK